MIPFTFPSSPSLVTGNAECKVWYLSSVTGLKPWTDYIPVKSYTSSSPVEGTTDAAGYQAVKPISSTTGLAAWSDYIPVYEVSSGTAWSTDNNGYIPVGAAGSRLSLNFAGASALDSRITFSRASTATYFNSSGVLTSAAINTPRFDYDPATPAGVTGGELVTNGDFSQGSTGWTVGGWVVAGGTATSVTGGGSAIFDSPSAYTTGKTYTVSFDVVTAVAGTTTVYVRGNNIGNPITTTTGRKTISGVAGTSGSRGVEFYGQPGLVIDNISVQEVTFTPRGLLVEEQRTNHETNGVAYTKSIAGDTVTQNAVAPDGTTTAYTILGDGTLGVHNVYQASVTPTSGNTYTVSVFLKAGTGSLVQLATSLAHSGATVYCNYNLSTQAMTAGAGIVANSNFITPIGNGWYRCGFSYVASATAAGLAITTGVITSISDTRLPTNTASTSYLRWGGQYESTSAMGSATFATSYIPTTTASATRSADSASMTGTNFSSWYSQGQGTFVVEGDFGSVTTTPVAFSVWDGTSANRMIVYNGRSFAANVASVSQGDITSSTAPTAGSVFKTAAAYQAANAGISVNASSVATSGTWAIPAVTSMNIGTVNASGGQSMNGHIRRIQYYPTRLPNATLQALTA